MIVYGQNIPNPQRDLLKMFEDAHMLERGGDPLGKPRGCFPSSKEIQCANREQLRKWYRELPIHLCDSEGIRLVYIAKRLTEAKKT